MFSYHIQFFSKASKYELRFLEDIPLTARLTAGQHAIAAIPPSVLGFGGIRISRAIKDKMKRKKCGPVGELVDVWNDVRAFLLPCISRI